MGSKENKRDNFILQAGLLAAAGMISRIIGLLYRSPLNAIIGERGLGFYQSTYEYYTIVLLISSYSIPAAISKVIAGKLAVKEYRNAHRIFKGALLYTSVVGFVGALFLFLGAPALVDKEVVPVLRTFAPTIFFYGFLGVLRGYFQAHKTMAQTSVSQILEQIVNAVVSIGAACSLIFMTMGTLEEPAELTGQIERARSGAIGSAMGTGAGVVAGLLFMLWVYHLNKRTIKRRIQLDTHTQEDSYRSIFKTITLVVTPFILSTAIYDLSKPINNSLYTKILPGMKNVVLYGGQDVYTKWGIFSGIAVTVSNIPIAFASAMASAMIPSIAQLVSAGDMKQAKEKIAQAIKTTMVVSIPCAAGLFSLAKPIVYLLFPRPDEVIDLAGNLLMALAVSVVLYSLSTLGNSILQGLGRVNVPMINSAVALLVQTIAAFALLCFTDLDLYSLVIANTLYAGIVCILNQWAVRRTCGYRQEWLRTILIPIASAALMGGVARGVFEGLLLLIKSSRIAVIFAIVVAVPVYFTALLLLRGLNEEELRAFPKGHLLAKLAKKLRLLR